jgi:hypothetical protein
MIAIIQVILTTILDFDSNEKYLRHVCMCAGKDLARLTKTGLL